MRDYPFAAAALAWLCSLATGCSGELHPAVPTPELSYPQCVFRPPEQHHPDAPVISLRGRGVVVLGVGDRYVDAGASATDAQDGDLSARVSTLGASVIDTAVRGDHLITYRVTDSDGHQAAPVTRLVRVRDRSFASYSLREYGTTAAPLGFLEHLPTFFGDDPKQTYPLLIVNHGWEHFVQQAPGEGVGALLRGTNIYRAFESGSWPDSRPFVVLSPQRCVNVGDFEWEAVERFVEWAVRTYAVDRSRIYMTGLSAGGYFTWRYPLLYPGRLAAIVPMSAGGPEVSGQEAAYCAALRDVAIWAFHGDSDTVVGFDTTISTVMMLRLQCSPGLVPQPRLSIIRGAGHDVAIGVWDDSLIGRGDPPYDPFDRSIYEWLLRFSLPSRPDP